MLLLVCNAASVLSVKSVESTIAEAVAYNALHCLHVRIDSAVFVNPGVHVSHILTLTPEVRYLILEWELIWSICPCCGKIKSVVVRRHRNFIFSSVGSSNDTRDKCQVVCWPVDHPMSTFCFCYLYILWKKTPLH